MIKETYRYTGNMPSGNPFLWYYDENQSTAFSTSKESRYWTKEPKIGDVIEFEKSGHYREIIEKIFINGELVFERTPEVEALKEKEEKQSLDVLVSETKRRLGVN